MRSILLAVVVLLAGQTHAIAADPATGWRGVKVLPKWGAVVKVGDETIDQTGFSSPWIVQDVKGEWLWVGNNRKGWVQQSQVVTLDEAPAYYTQLIRSNQHKAWAYLNRGQMWAEKGDLELAIADFGDALRLNPAANTFIWRGIGWTRKKDYEKAIADFNEAIRLDPNNVWAYGRRGVALSGKKDYDRAIADYNQAMRLDPNQPNIYYNMACCYALQHQIDPAIDNLRRSLKLGFSDTSLLKSDSDLDSIRTDPRFRELLRQYTK